MIPKSKKVEKKSHLTKYCLNFCARLACLIFYSKLLKGSIWPKILLTLETETRPPLNFESRSANHNDLHSAKVGPLVLQDTWLSKVGLSAIFAWSQAHFANPVEPEGHWTTASSP